MSYDGIFLKNIFTIGKIYSIHYFEYMNDFSFDGETHDFWEFICVDKGEVSITAGNRGRTLRRGEIAFHQPNEFHAVHANGTSAPNLVVVSFQCDDRAMDFFRKKIFSIDDMERNLLANIIIESRRCFDCRLDDPYLQNMPQKPEEMAGAQQLIRLYLEHFLIHLLRRYSHPVVISSLSDRAFPSTAKKSSSRTEPYADLPGLRYRDKERSKEEELSRRVCQPPASNSDLGYPVFPEGAASYGTYPSREPSPESLPHPDFGPSLLLKNDTELFYRVTDYLEAHLCCHLTIQQICKDNLIGRSQLQKLFRLRCRMGIIEYFSLMKINAAKELIRTRRLNFTQISEQLGYTSIHYFSRQFKKLTGMTPSEYASSIKAMAERTR